MNASRRRMTRERLAVFAPAAALMYLGHGWNLSGLGFGKSPGGESVQLSRAALGLGSASRHGAHVPDHAHVLYSAVPMAHSKQSDGRPGPPPQPDRHACPGSAARRSACRRRGAATRIGRHLATTLWRIENAAGRTSASARSARWRRRSASRRRTCSSNGRRTATQEGRRGATTRRRLRPVSPAGSLSRRQARLPGGQASSFPAASSLIPVASWLASRRQAGFPCGKLAFPCGKLAFPCGKLVLRRKLALPPASLPSRRQARPPASKLAFPPASSPSRLQVSFPDGQASLIRAGKLALPAASWLSRRQA